MYATFGEMVSALEKKGWFRLGKWGFKKYMPYVYTVLSTDVNEHGFFPRVKKKVRGDNRPYSVRFPNG